MPTQDPVITIRNLLNDNWNPANINGYDVSPRVHTGWWNDSWNEVQITLTTMPESPVGGGETGFEANSSAGGPVRRNQGLIAVNCWAHGDMQQQGIISSNPKSVVYDMSEEVKRIIDSTLLNVGQGLDWVVFMGKRPVVHANDRPVLYRYDCDVRYQYYDRL